MLKEIECLRVPKEPGPDDCCHTDCNPCVFMRYENDIDKYEEKRARIRIKYEEEIEALG